MFFLAGAGASSAFDMLSSLKSSVDSAATKTGVTPFKSAFSLGEDSAAASSSSASSSSTSLPAMCCTPATMQALFAVQSQDSSTSTSSAADKLFAAIDQDGDGSITSSEFTQAFDKDSNRASRVFSKLDTNQDGTVSAEELSAGVNAMRQRAQQAQAAGQPGNNAVAAIERMIQRQSELLASKQVGQTLAVAA